MSGYLAEMFPESHVPEIAGTYCIDTGVVNLPNLLPVIEKLVADNQGLRPVKQKDTTMQDSTPFTAQTFSKAATEEMQPRTPHPSETVEAIMRKLEDSPLLTENEKHILFSHIQDGSQYAAPLPLSIAKDDDGHFCIAIAGRKWKIMRHGIIGNGAADREDFHQAASELVDNALPFSDAGIERTILADDLISAQGESAKYRLAMLYRSKADKSLGETAHEVFAVTMNASKIGPVLNWHALHDAEQIAWNQAAMAAFMSVALDPADIKKEIQILALRKRMLLLRRVNASVHDIGSVAAEINAIAGPVTS